MSRWTLKHTMCLRKKKFQGKDVQKHAIKHNQHAYHCPYCNSWHLTKTKRDDK